MPELKFISYKNGRLAYREEGFGPVLFLLHGMNGSSKSWRHLFKTLSSAFRVIAWDAPSFGSSDCFGNTILDYKNAAKTLLDKLSIKETLVIGHSMGGIIAAQLAADDDIKISGLVLSSSHLGFAMPKGEDLMPRYAELIYNGFWYSPEREMLQSAIDFSQRNVNGTVRLKLYKGNTIVVGRKSEKSLYSADYVTFEQGAADYNHADAHGFIRLNALRLRLNKMMLDDEK